MFDTISPGLRTAFLIQTIVAAFFGVTLWIVPGRTLLILLDWEPIPGAGSVDPILVRILAGGMLAAAFTCYRARLAEGWSEVALLVQGLFLFYVFGFLATLVVLLLLAPPELPMFLEGWILAVILAAFSLVWGLALRRHPL